MEDKIMLLEKNEPPHLQDDGGLSRLFLIGVVMAAWLVAAIVITSCGTRRAESPSKADSAPASTPPLEVFTPRKKTAPRKLSDPIKTTSVASGVVAFEVVGDNVCFMTSLGSFSCSTLSKALEDSKDLNIKAGDLLASKPLPLTERKPESVSLATPTEAPSPLLYAVKKCESFDVRVTKIDGKLLNFTPSRN